MENAEEIRLFLNRIKDLAQASYQQNRYTFSAFLTPDEQALVASIKSDIDHVDYEMFGGHESCERRLIRFGSENTLGYVEDYPIAVLLVEPLMEKFSEELGHRDYLGSLMNLGIKRNVIGDIILKDKKAYIFCLEEVAEYIIKELTRIKHTSIKITRVTGEIDALQRELVDMDILVSAPRFDAIVAAITKLSRGKAFQLFLEKKVLLEGRVCENNSLVLKPGQTFSIRGYGKYIFDGEGGHTKKDRVYIRLKMYN